LPSSEKEKNARGGKKVFCRRGTLKEARNLGQIEFGWPLPKWIKGGGRGGNGMGFVPIRKNG